MNALIVFLKYPQAGKVKTRLGKVVGYDTAARLYEIFIADTFDMVAQSRADACFAAFAPHGRYAEIQRYIPEGVAVFPQEGGDLGERMLKAFEHLFEGGADKVVIVGSDSPTLPVEYIGTAFLELDRHELVLGPAEDGGYYLIGLNRPVTGLFDNIVWSSVNVMADTLALADKLTLSYFLLPSWYDIDDLTTLRRAAKSERSGRLQHFLQQHSEILEAPQ